VARVAAEVAADKVTKETRVTNDAKVARVAVNGVKVASRAVVKAASRAVAKVVKAAEADPARSDFRITQTSSSDPQERMNWH